MTEQQKNRTNHRQAPPWEREADAETAPFGSWLRQQREMREITLREISDATKISLRYLEALEQERLDLLPARVFARGFLRQYARYVGLDPDEAVNRLLVAEKDEEEEDERERTRDSPRRFSRGAPTGAWKNVLLVAGLAGLLLGLVFLIPWLMERMSARGGPEAPPPGVAPPGTADDRPAPPAEPAPESFGAPLAVTLDFRENCWVEAAVDGEPRVAEMRVQGESLQLQAEERVTLRLGNAGAVDIEVNGRPFDIGASPGEVRSVEIDLDDLPGGRPAGGEASRAGETAPGAEA
jgi:transcriptional regulator with XRE-family HTH domain